MSASGDELEGVSVGVGVGTSAHRGNFLTALRQSQRVEEVEEESDEKD